MKEARVKKGEIKLVGISVRTSYDQELDKMNGKIFPCVQKYFHGALWEKIMQRKTPGTTFCAYTDYEGDYKGAYTYFIGEEVSSIEKVPEGFHTLTIPSQDYVKFTNGPAPMPDVVVKAWEAIWEMPLNRHYATDFEIYDERAADHQKIVLDIYVGLK